MTPAQKLKEFYDLFVEGVKAPGGDDSLENGVASFIDLISDGKDATIACSAIFAYQNDLPIDEVHPFSKGGMDLHEIVGMFAWLAIKQISPNGDECEFETPEWIHTPDDYDEPETNASSSVIFGKQLSAE